MGSHFVGERFVLLQVAGMLRPQLALGDLNVDRQYKASSFGEPVGASVARTFRCTGAALKPIAPCHFVAFRHQPATNDWLLKWTRRARVAANWLPSIDVPLDEASEEYSVDILNTASGAVVRTLSTVTSPTATYTAADQSTDFGSVQTTIRARVYQLSAAVGRGFPAERTF